VVFSAAAAVAAQVTIVVVPEPEGDVLDLLQGKSLCFV